MTASLASPWKPCDLRGLYPAAVNEEMLRRVGAAIASQMKSGERVVVAGDFRLSTPSLKAALIDGLANAGLHVLDGGQIPTPLAYFAATQTQADGIFVVTASHNPADYNGLKWTVHGLPPSLEAIAQVRAAAEAGCYRSAPGTVERFDVVPAYCRWMESAWNPATLLRNGSLVVDAGNGAWSVLGPRILRSLGFEVVHLFCEPDGRFPNRPADCARTANLAALRKAVVEAGAVLGIAWDGDGDRAAFVDQNGVHATPDEISILFAREILAHRSPGERVICDIKLSDLVRREILRLDGTPLLERSGHAFMRRRLLKEGAVLGLDACGHYFFRQTGSRDDGLYSALLLLEIIAKHGSLAELRATLGPLFTTPELRIPAVALSYEIVVGRLRAAFPGAEELAVDGARLTAEDGIVLSRESSTEPVVSLRIEGFTEQRYHRIVSRCLAALPEVEPLLLRQIAESAEK